MESCVVCGKLMVHPNEAEACRLDYVGFDPDKAHLFLYYFFVFVLPATFVNLVVFSLAISVHESKHIS